MPQEFVWTTQLTSVMEQVPEGPDRDAFVRGLVEYLALGREPEFEYPLSAIFLALSASLPKATQEVAGTDGPSGDDDVATTDARVATEPEPEFVPPTLDDVCARVTEMGYEDVDPKEFFGYYEAHGWRSGSSPIKSWKRALSLWNSRNKRDRAPKITLDEVRAYIKERGYSIDPDSFYNYYAASKWHRNGGAPIYDFRPVCDEWERRDHLNAPSQVVTQDKPTQETVPKWFDTIPITEFSNEGVHVA